MRIVFAIVFCILCAALVVCAILSRKSTKPIGRSVALMQVGLIPPVIGNFLIIISGSEILSTIGCYIYFLGMDLAVFALIRFTFSYCHITWPNKWIRNIVYGFLIADVVQMLLNPVFGQAFTTRPIIVEGSYYYSLVPLIGQSFHRIVDYGVFLASIIIFIVKLVRSPRIDSERYGVILLAMIITGLWQTFYIFSRTPMDRSMIGFGVFGLLVYFFALCYKPVRLLDHMLANIASEIPESLLFFDVNGQCIWMNETARRLTGIDENLEAVPARLKEIFGQWRQKTWEWKDQYTFVDNGIEKTCVIERHKMTDDRGRIAGWFLRIRDNTQEQRTLQREIYHATHDELTGVYNRAGYGLLLDRIDLKTACMLVFDIDFFKAVNDTHGHTKGDHILKKVTKTVMRHFRSEDTISRIGGDEFVILMSDVIGRMDQLIRSKTEAINHELEQSDDGLPAVSLSVGVAYGSDVESKDDLFNQADKALYAAKEGGRRRCVIYREGVR